MKVKLPERPHCCVGWLFQLSTPITSRDKTSPATRLKVGILKLPTDANQPEVSKNGSESYPIKT